MVKYHPDTRYLTEYAAGSLSRSLALCVAAHLHYCPVCRARVRDLTALGAELFTRQGPMAMDDSAFARLWARVEALPAARPAPSSRAERNGGLPRSPSAPIILPPPIHKLARGGVERLAWRSMGKSYRYFRLPAGDDRRLTQLLHIRAGGKVPQHWHTGEEITVVLKGSFSDREDHYHLGDFVVRGAGEKHRPVAAQHEDCLCLATLDAPITMTNWLFRLLQPLMKRRIA